MKFLTIFVFAIFISSPSAQILPNLWDRIRERILERLRQPINGLIVSAIESQRVNFPSLGLEPLFIAEFDFESSNMGNLADFKFHLEDSYLRGLQNFQIQHLDFRILQVSFETVFFFDQLVITGNHRTEARLAIIPINGAGDITITFRNVTLSAKAAFALIKGDHLHFNDFYVKMHVEQADATFTGFGVFDDIVSAAVSSSLTAIINLNDGDLIANVIETTVNALLNEIRLRDIILSIVGGLTDEIFDEKNFVDEIEKTEVQRFLSKLLDVSQTAEQTQLD